MALNIESQWGGQSTPATTDYPQGSGKDVSTPTGTDGLPFVKILTDDTFGFQQALLKETVQTPTGNPDTAIASQYLDAVRLMAQADRKNVDIYPTPSFETTQITIEPCVVWDRTGTKLIRLTSQLTKDISAVWVFGDGNGGRTTPALANNIGYHKFLILKDGGLSPDLVDAGWDTAADASNLLTQTGYDYAARISFYHTELASTNLMLTYKRGDLFYWGNKWTDFNHTSITLDPTYTTVDLLTPGGVATDALIRLILTPHAADQTVLVGRPTFMSGSARSMIAAKSNGTGADEPELGTNILTDTNSQIEWAYTGGTPVETVIAAYGWRDFLSIE